jgi:CheY-like chemotaxis protein
LWNLVKGGCAVACAFLTQRHAQTELEKIMTGMKILCVENEPDYMATITTMLEGIGYEVMAATSERQAIEVFTRQSIDGVLLEYNLPDGVGTDLRARLKRMRPDVPVFLYAGVGTQTPFMVRFFDAYLRNGERHDDGPGEFES